MRFEKIRRKSKHKAIVVATRYPAKLIRSESISIVADERHDIAQHGANMLSLAGSSVHFRPASDRLGQ